MSSQYYQVLGITTKASLDQIKKAYRKKAKKLHPDVNKAPDAHEQFVLLNEAYEYLEGLRTGKIKATSSRRRASSRRTARRKPQKTYEQWKKEERARAQARAREYARMKFEEYKKTDAYKAASAFFNLTDVIFYILSWFILIGGPILGYSLNGWAGFGFACFFVFVSVGFWGPTIQNRSDIEFKEIPELFRILFRSQIVWLILGVAFHLGIFLKVGLNTLLPLPVLLGVLIVSPFIGSILAIQKRKWKQVRRYLHAFVIVPSVFSGLLLINYVFSAQPVVETYSFSHMRVSSGGQHGRSRKVKSSLIQLEEGKYNNYAGIRFFFNYKSMENSNRISYKMAKGLLGFKVVKSHQFH